MMCSLKSLFFLLFTFCMPIAYIKDAYRWSFTFPHKLEKRKTVLYDEQSYSHLLMRGLIGAPNEQAITCRFKFSKR